MCEDIEVYVRYNGVLYCATPGVAEDTYQRWFGSVDCSKSDMFTISDLALTKLEKSVDAVIAAVCSNMKYQSKDGDLKTEKHVFNRIINNAAILSLVPPVKIILTDINLTELIDWVYTISPDYIKKLVPVNNMLDELKNNDEVIKAICVATLTVSLSTAKQDDVLAKIVALLVAVKKFCEDLAKTK